MSVPGTDLPQHGNRQAQDRVDSDVSAPYEGRVTSVVYTTRHGFCMSMYRRDNPYRARGHWPCMGYRGRLPWHGAIYYTVFFREASFPRIGPVMRALQALHNLCMSLCRLDMLPKSMHSMPMYVMSARYVCLYAVKAHVCLHYLWNSLLLVSWSYLLIACIKYLILPARHVHGSQSRVYDPRRSLD